MEWIQFDIVSLMLNPFILMFFTVLIGVLIGKISIGKFSLGTSGVLFAGLGIGWIAYKVAISIYEHGENAPGIKAALQIMEGNNGKLINNYFFSASLIIFVACVGLLAAKDLGVVLRKYGGKFIVLGILITFIGAGGTYISSSFVKDTNPFAMCGVYTGAMTSSPGLASAMEAVDSRATDMADGYEDLKNGDKQLVLDILADENTEKKLTLDNTKTLTEKQKNDFVHKAVAQVGIGSAVAYPFGVIIVILAVNFINIIFGFDIDIEKKKYDIEMTSARKFVDKKIPTMKGLDITSFMIVCLIGYFLGSIKIYAGPLGYVSLESTGGVLIASLILGYIGKIGPISFRLDDKILSALRELGLAFFLSVVGLNYGYGVFDAIQKSGFILVGISLIVGLISILVGFLVGRYIFKLNWILLSGGLCGGMTSTPGLGAATDAIGSDDPGVGYGATYPFALLGMVLFTIILMKLPII